VTEGWRIALGIMVALALATFTILPSRMWTWNNVAEHVFPQDRPDESLNALGGAAWSWYFLYGRASWPFVRVEIDSVAIRIRSATRWSSWYVPTVTIPWVQAESVSPSGASGAIAIRMPNRPGLIRVSLWNGSLAAELRRLGVPLTE